MTWRRENERSYRHMVIFNFVMFWENSKLIIFENTLPSKKKQKQYNLDKKANLFQMLHRLSCKEGWSFFLYEFSLVLSQAFAQV